MLATLFGAAALLLAAVGLYGLAARRVEERRRELSVRIALGAQWMDVHRLVLADTLRTLAIGLAIGVPAAFAASQALRALLFEVSPSAPHTFAIASALLALTAAAATIAPARRAAGADPIAALKE
jgi:ABC-type antimicrobial peptide transport system permease subunit